MEPNEAALRSAEIRGSGGKPIIFYPTSNVRPGTAIAIVAGTVGFEGTWRELAAAGLIEKADVVLLHPHTKAEIDSALQKAERKFKPGEAVAGLNRGR